MIGVHSQLFIKMAVSGHSPVNQRRRSSVREQAHNAMAQEKARQDARANGHGTIALSFTHIRIKLWVEYGSKLTGSGGHIEVSSTSPYAVAQASRSPMPLGPGQALRLWQDRGNVHDALDLVISTLAPSGECSSRSSTTPTGAHAKPCVL